MNDENNSKSACKLWLMIILTSSLLHLPPLMVSLATLYCSITYVELWGIQTSIIMVPKPIGSLIQNVRKGERVWVTDCASMKSKYENESETV